MKKETSRREAALQPSIAVDLGGIKLKNPVVAASGTFGYGSEYEGFIDPAELGAVSVKGTTLEPRPGNPPRRICETASGMLNSIGLENPGIEVFLRDYLPGLNSRGVVVLANIAGNSVEEYARMASLINDSTGVAGIEMNISCPNVKQGGLQFGTDPDMVYQVVKAVREQTTLPVIPKLSPNVSDIVAIARAAQAAGADALSMINTLMGMAVDIKTRRPVLGNIFGGLSGPAIKPVALRMVYQVYKEVDLPILAGGGIINGNDALEFIMVGATAVSIGTGIFLNPFLGRDIVQGILRYMKENGLKNLEQIRGVAVD